MLLPVRPHLPPALLCPRSMRTGAAALALIVLGCPLAAQAQEADPAQESASPPAQPAAEESEQIQFEADGASYDDNTETVAVFGNVVLRRGDQSVRADQLTWDRKTGKIVATGNIRLVDADGNQLFTDSIELTDELKAGAMDNMLLALREGGRLAANKGERLEDGKVLLHTAAYSTCAVEDDQGCPRKPSWRITARRVIFDPDKKSLRFEGARGEIFGLRLMPLPALTLATDGRPINGLLIPDVQLSASNGVQFSQSWYQRLSDNRDVSVTGYVFTEALPMVSAQYRQLTSQGSFQVTGYLTRSSRIPIGGPLAASQSDFRGYLYTNVRS